MHVAGGADGQVDAEHPLGDVRQRQVGDPADPRHDDTHGLGRRHLVQDVPVGEHDALGVAGGARGVQQGQRVPGLDRRHPGGDLIRVGGAPVPAQRHQAVPGHVPVTGRAGPRVPDDDRGEPGQPVQDRLPAGQLGRPVQHRDPGITVRGHVRDLFRRQRGVQRHPQAARMHRAQVGQHVLAAVREHQRDPLAGRQPQCGEPGRYFQHPLPRLRPGQGLPAITGPGLVGVRVGITAGLGHLPQFIAQRAARYHALDFSPLRHYVAAHYVLHPPHTAAGCSSAMRTTRSWRCQRD